MEANVKTSSAQHHVHNCGEDGNRVEMPIIVVPPPPVDYVKPAVKPKEQHVDCKKPPGSFRFPKHPHLQPGRTVCNGDVHVSETALQR